jgi:serine/threonine protein kinase
MSLTDHHADDPVATADLAHVIAACERFEADWNAGRSRLIEQELAAAPDPVRGHLFRELLAVELELTRRGGRPTAVEEYLARFPDRADAVREVFIGSILPPPDPEATWSLAPAELPPSPSPEGFELLRPLGEGGQATTYLARDRALQRLVVLKRYHGIASTGRLEAVLNEGRALARVRSPYVATCLGVETRGHEIDLIVEYVPGRPLTELTAEERANLWRSSRLIEQVAGGLAEVHACGLLHRDIKPQNIILGDDGLPRLVDFGLAIPVASEALHEVSGSPPYMAPEQARGQGERVDSRTDIYGLGAVLYFLWTAKPPHVGATLKEVLEQARDALVVPPRRINRRVPRALERVCMKALASDPQARYPSADALRQALRRCRLTRLAAPALVAVAILFALLVPAWVFWAASVRPSQESSRGETILERTTESRSDPKQTPQAGLRVTRFEIPHFPKLDDKSYDVKAAGLLGRKSFTPRLEDDVTIQAELSEPAYSYLIAFRPDGTDELCDPDDEVAPPRRKQTPSYPPPSKSDERYRLSEGAGLYAFALVVSRQPLPTYREWKRRTGPMAWAARLPCEPGVVWRDDGEGLWTLVAEDTARTRGKGAKARGSGEPIARLASWLRGLSGVDAVTLEAFSVEPASGP